MCLNIEISICWFPRLLQRRAGPSSTSPLRAKNFNKEEKHVTDMWVHQLISHKEPFSVGDRKDYVVADMVVAL